MMRMTDPLTTVELPEGGALCAVSGGLDSMCLLEMTVRQGQKQGRRVAAAHFNHQLRVRRRTGTRRSSGTGAPP